MLTILVVPVAIDPGAGVGIAVLLVIAAGIVAILSATALSYVSRSPEQPKKSRPDRKQRDGAMSVPAKMACQMFFALALAFAVGMTAFPAHWPWVVLSAFIVCSGAVGRGDALYKALLRLGGAIGGTFVAALAARVTLPNSAAYATVVFVVLFAGIWLRPISYAFWAACATLIFALLQGSHVENPHIALWPSRSVHPHRRRLRRPCGVVRLSDSYRAGRTPPYRRRVSRHARYARRRSARWGISCSPQLDRVAPPVRLHRMVFGAEESDEHPAGWIDRTHALLRHMSAPEFDRTVAATEIRRLGSLIRQDHPKPRGTA